MKDGHQGHTVKLISGQWKSAVEQAKVGREEKLETLRILDMAIQDMICASESTDKAFLLEDSYFNRWFGDS
jgi:hypothetical protein